MFDIPSTTRIRDEQLRLLAEAFAPVLVEVLTPKLIEALLAQKIVRLPDPVKEEYYSISEVAAIIRRDRTTIYKYISRGVLVSFQKTGIRGKLISRASVDNLLTRVNLQSNNVTKNNF